MGLTLESTTLAIDPGADSTAREPARRSAIRDRERSRVTRRELRPSAAGLRNCPAYAPPAESVVLVPRPLFR